ncbi:MAG: NAD(+)/NADH kinase [Candidatus Aenigmarchaeota archaeon]|nr:NAD(+)/NADH kinase [Candidatus Aenigmarchaeota archaeon]
MFSKVFVAWKKNYGEKIALKVCSILREYDVEYTFRELKGCDLAIVVGGDGTLLKFQSSLECPMLGINPGRSVGHYMSATNKDFETKLRKLLTGKEGKDYFLRIYPRLETAINGTDVPFFALNEVLVSPIYVRRIMDSELTANGKKSKERNTGIIFYTPSGSYAYAKSAGAEIIKDDTKFGAVAIAPYAGKLKKGEILSEKEMRLTHLRKRGELCVDGQPDQTITLNRGDTILVKKNGHPVTIVWFSVKK